MGLTYAGAGKEAFFGHDDDEDEDDSDSGTDDIDLKPFGIEEEPWANECATMTLDAPTNRVMHRSAKGRDMTLQCADALMSIYCQSPKSS